MTDLKRVVRSDSAMRETDYQTGQQQAVQFHTQQQYQQQQQQQQQRQGFQGAGIGPGPAPRVPLNQVCYKYNRSQEHLFRPESFQFFKATFGHFSLLIMFTITAKGIL